jgi:hypothetical protein
VKSNDNYLVTISNKEKILYAQLLSFNASVTAKMRVNATLFELVNGGVLILNLWKVEDLNDSSSLLERGEILFFKKPASVLDVVITTDKDSYSPGDVVDY